MISSVLALAMLAQPADLPRVRKEYSACLTDFMKKSLKEKAEDSAFETGIAAACSAQEQKFRAIVIATDTAARIKRADAEENATIEINDKRANATEMFKDYKTSNTSPR